MGSPADIDCITPANRLGLDYEREASRLGSPPVPITDAHTHISGEKAAALYRRVCDLYGVQRVYSMTHLEQIDPVRAALGDRIRFIAIPNYADRKNARHHMGEGYLERIRQFHQQGARIVKFWVAPRSIDFARSMGDPDLLRLTSPTKVAAMELATELGMIFMVHVADPDTWFKARYSDASVYGTKEAQYEPLEVMLDRFTQPWIAAHMGGWPEDLSFLTGLLERHDNLYLDTSATKWQVRELSRHSRDDLLEFLRRFKGRILFGSDIVTTEEHLTSTDEENEQTAKAGSHNEAFDLYASRYWAMRTLFETDYDGESPIADPDLHMVDPESHTEMDAPPLRGKSLPADVLSDVYMEAAANLLDPIHD